MRLRVFAAVAVLLSAACTAQTVQPTGVIMTEIINTPTPIATVAPSATAESTASGPVTLHVWWPEPLAPVDNGDAADLLSEQISAFQSSNRDITVDFRLKKAQDVGGIMSTLRSASLVAPGALPDLTLLRRSDLLTAAQTGLILPMEDRVAAPILENLHPTVAALGRVNDRLYGLPYNVEVQHLAWQKHLTPPPSWSFADVLTSRFAFVFPAGRPNNVSDVFLAQYRAATEALSSDGITVDANKLRTLFEFYQKAVEQKLLDPSVLQYTAPTDYRDGLASGEIPAGVVTSTLYLQLAAKGTQLNFAPFPTQSGTPTTVVDGWMWVLTTADSVQQAASLRFLNWMLDVDRQGHYNQLIDMLPSQRTALRQWEDAKYATFVDTLLNNATLPLSESTGGVTARVIQSALTSVISGQRTAAQAAQDVITQLPS